jgi:4'-phosphopantetheinyl transferase
MMRPPSNPAIEVWIIDLVRDGAALEARAMNLSIVPDAGGTPIAEPERRAAHAALRLLIARRAGLAVARQPFRLAPGGKPGLGGGALEFSLAHSGSRALVALAAPGTQVGVDIEAPRSLRMGPARRADIARAAILAAGGAPLPAGGSDASALQAWVRLEAVAKATGEGIGSVLARLGARDGVVVESVGSASAPGAGVVRLFDLTLEEGHHGALAWLGADPGEPPQVQVLDASPAALDAWLAAPAS